MLFELCLWKILRVLDVSVEDVSHFTGTSTIRSFVLRAANQIQTKYKILLYYCYAIQRAAILLSKLVGYNVSLPVVNWILSFLTGRSQVCKVNGQLSAPCPINQGIVQGSGIGPQLYITMKSDLKAISIDINLFKYFSCPRALCC